jgi:enterochelin esterase-like enzyme
MKLIWFIIFSIAVHFTHAQGTVRVIDDFKSAIVTNRGIRIWLPGDFDSTKKHAVIYMQDGQMLFSANTWNGQYWRVGEIADSMIKLKKIIPLIIVGIDNNGAMRHNEYCPQKPLAAEVPLILDSILRTSNRTNGNKIFADTSIASDNYLRFIVEELKPFIDRSFPTFTDAQHTAIAGSSMGALISVYAFCEYPEVFGKAACFSTHWPVLFSNQNNPFPNALFRYLHKNFPKAIKKKIYFDKGEQGIDSLYEIHQVKMNRLLKQKRYNRNNYVSLNFPGDGHTETAWSRRLPVALEFLFGINSKR